MDIKKKRKEIKKRMLEAATPCIDDEWHGEGYPTMAEILIENVIEVISPDVMIVDREAKDFPDMVFYCPTCDKMVKNTKANITDTGYVKAYSLEENDSISGR